jgi:arylsulfatase A-like enzyme
MFTGRRTSSIEAWSNVKSLTADVSEWPPQRPDPNCANIVGFSAQHCLELGRRQNVSSTLNMAMSELGYNVKLFGKMDTGGGPLMNPPGTHGTGYHDNGNWSEKELPVTTYYPGCLLHSLAAGANISKAAFAPLDGPNKWIDTQHASYGQGDWTIVDNCIQFLMSYRKGDPPFFLYCSVINPHPPYTSNATWEANIDMVELERSLDWTEKTYATPNNQHPADTYASSSEGVPLRFNRTLARELAIAYHGACVEVDSMVGKVRSALQQSAAADHTYFVLTSDHGEMHMEHRRVEKMSMYEASVRVPLLVEGPAIPVGVRVDDFVTLVDLFPTFLDMGQTKTLPDAGLQGYSLAPYLGIHSQRKLGKRPDYAIAEYTAEEANTPQFMIRMGDWKYIAYGQEPPYQHYYPQLFNVTADPWELSDLAGESTHRKIVQQLDAKLREIVDYPTVAKKLNSENRDNIRRWMSSFSEAGWHELVRAAYKGANQSDTDKLVRWLNSEGEFGTAPPVGTLEVAVNYV